MDRREYQRKYGFRSMGIYLLSTFSFILPSLTIRTCFLLSRKVTFVWGLQLSLGESVVHVSKFEHVPCLFVIFTQRNFYEHTILHLL